MRKLILKMEVSLDCFVATPDGNQNWLFNIKDEGINGYVMDTISNAGLHLMGSRVFNDMMSYWPFSDEPFAAPMNDIPKAVYTRHEVNMEPNLEKGAAFFTDYTVPKTIQDMLNMPGSAEKLAGWKNARVLKGDLTTEINSLKQQSGKYILVQGGSGFAQALTALNLVDEYRIVIYPVALGKGMPLFGSGTKPLELNLIQTHIFESGVAVHVYRSQIS